MIKHRRKLLKLTYQEFSKRTGGHASIRTLKRIESGEEKNPKLGTLLGIREACGMHDHQNWLKRLLKRGGGKR